LAEVPEEHGNPTRQGAMAGPHHIFVHIVRGINLEYLKHFNGHNSYCACEVQSSSGPIKASRVETKALTSGNGNRFSPCWNEAWDIEGLWQGDELEFTIYDEGLVASGTEGKVVLPSDKIFPDGFSGTLPILGLEQAMLEVTVSVGRAQPILRYDLTQSSVETLVYPDSTCPSLCPWIFNCCRG